MKLALKYAIRLFLTLLFVLFIQNVWTALVGKEITVQSLHGEDVTLTRKKVWIPFMLDMKVIDDGNLGFISSQLWKAGGEMGFSNGFSYHFTKKYLRGADTLGGMFIGSRPEEKMSGFTMNAYKGDPDQKFPESVIDVLRDPIEAFSNMGAVPVIQSFSKDITGTMYFVEYSNPVSRMDAWETLVTEMSVGKDTDLLINMVTSSIKEFDSNALSSRYWLYIVFNDGELDEHNVSVYAFAKTRAKFEEELADMKDQQTHEK